MVFQYLATSELAVLKTIEMVLGATDFADPPT
jgi:hypothetical protein